MVEFACSRGSGLEPPALVAEEHPTRSVANAENIQGPDSQNSCDGMIFYGGIGMYAVIRAGGKQYRVAPGDVIRVENQGDGTDGNIVFNDVIAMSDGEGQIGRPESDASVIGQVVEQGRAKKILVFHYKRKKQYKKLRGHRQGYTAVRITEIGYNGKKFSAPELPKKEAKPEKPAAEEVEKPVVHAQAKPAKSHTKKKAVAKKAPAKKSAPKKKK
ncbi:MAG: large subunit ribosomal protein [Acidobacteriaceae bacterium]|jgi:large subunit ribosomal protein L21